MTGLVTRPGWPARIWIISLFIGVATLALAEFAAAEHGEWIRDDLDWAAGVRQSVRDSIASRRHPSGWLARGVRSSLGAYQALVSSQDASHCQFEPSCSQFAPEAIAVQGPVKGFLMASARVQRCSPFARFQYPRDPQTGRLYDPVYLHLHDAARPRSGLGASFGGGEVPPAASGRKPWMAMTMSAVLPGAGQTYAGRPLDGVSSFLGTAIPAAFAARGFDRDGVGSVRGWFHGAMALAFYLGNVWDAGDAVHQANDRPGRHAALSFDQAGQAFPQSRDPWKDAFDRRIATLDRVATERSRPALAYRAALTAYAGCRYDEAIVRCMDLARVPQTASRARVLQALSHAENHQWSAARTALTCIEMPALDTGFAASVRAGLTYFETTEIGGGLSPRKASWLSALLPGAGQLYSRAYFKGITSLGLNALAGYYVYRCAQTDSPVEMLVAAVPLFWRYYRGGMKSAARCAREYNQRIHEREVQELYRAMDLRRPPQAGDVR